MKKLILTSVVVLLLSIVFCCPLWSAPDKPHHGEMTHMNKKTVAIIVMGTSVKAGLLELYGQSIFPTVFDPDYEMVQLEPEDNSSTYRLVIESIDTAGRTLEHYGSTTRQYSVTIGVKLITVKTAKITAGPFVKAIQFTNFNEPENLKSTVKELMVKLYTQLKESKSETEEAH